MAKEAEAIREKRARIIKAEAEEEASVKLVQASERITQSPMLSSSAACRCSRRSAPSRTRRRSS
jgi:hypothetical protein